MLRLRRSIALSSSINIQKLLEEARSQFFFSGYQLYSECQGKALSLSGGVTSYWPNGAAVSESTLFDIGSLTKVIVTTSLFALRMDKEEFPLTSEVKSYLPQLSKTWMGDLTLNDLMSHSSGLKAWLPIYEEIKNRPLLDWFVAQADSLRAGPVRGQVIYSDLNFLLLGQIWESKKEKISVSFDKLIKEPLKMTETAYGPVDPDNSAATEYTKENGGPLQGEVFDANARALGSQCSHAGLFSTARSLAPFCREWLTAVKGKSKWLSQAVALKLTTPSRFVSGSSWGLGWDTKSPQGSSAGSEFSEKSFGHLGYPGCSLWVDPEKEGFAIFLSNRIHPSRNDERIRILRPTLHNAIAGEWKQSWKK